MQKTTKTGKFSKIYQS